MLFRLSTKKATVRTVAIIYFDTRVVYDRASSQKAFLYSLQT